MTAHLSSRSDVSKCYFKRGVAMLPRVSLSSHVLHRNVTFACWNVLQVLISYVVGGTYDIYVLLIVTVYVF